MSEEEQVADIVYDAEDIRTPTAEELSELAELAQELVAAERAVEKAADKLKAAKQELDSIALYKIPLLMAECGAGDNFPLPGGGSVEISTAYGGSILKDRKGEAHRWLIDNGHGGMVKRSVVVAFAMKQEEKAAKLMAELQKTHGTVIQVEKVESASLRAWVKKMIEARKNIDRELFGVFVRRQAKVVIPKRK